MTRWRTGFSLVCAFALLLALAGDAAAALEPINQTTFGGVAIDGWDPVAYFTDSKPVEGDKAYSFDWNGATWRFASAAHRDLFAQAPEKYAPQYGGYCAWAVAEGGTASGDPRYWKIVDGKLYLNYDADVQKKWEKDIPGNIGRANRNWPSVLGK